MKFHILGITITLFPRRLERLAAREAERQLADYQFGIIHDHMKSLDVDGRIDFVLSLCIDASPESLREYCK